MIQLIDKFGVFPDIKKRYLIDTSNDLSELETTFGNEAYCITDKKTYICNSSGVYVEKASGGGSSLPDVTDVDNGKVLGVSNGQWTKVSNIKYDLNVVIIGMVPAIQNMSINNLKDMLDNGVVTFTLNNIISQMADAIEHCTVVSYSEIVQESEPTLYLTVYSIARSDHKPKMFVFNAYNDSSNIKMGYETFLLTQ